MSPNFMPHVPYWIHRLPEALAVLGKLSAETIDRAALQKLLGVRKTEAWSLLRRWGAEPIGGALVLSREKLLLALKSTQEDSGYAAEPARLARVQEQIDQARRERRRSRVLVPIHNDELSQILGQTFAGLPDQVRIGPGRIEIASTDAADALRKLLELAQTISNEYDEFERLFKAR